MGKSGIKNKVKARIQKSHKFIFLKENFSQGRKATKRPPFQIRRRREGGNVGRWESKVRSITRLLNPLSIYINIRLLGKRTILNILIEGQEEYHIPITSFPNKNEINTNPLTLYSGFLC